MNAVNFYSLIFFITSQRFFPKAKLHLRIHSDCLLFGKNPNTMKSLFKTLAVVSCFTLFSHCSDNSDPGKNLPKLSIDDATAQEGADIVFTVSLSAASTETVSFSYTTAHGTTSDADFETVSNNGSVDIAPGQTSVEISISLNTDNETETAETFTVTLANPANAALSDDAVGNGTITNKAIPNVLKVKIAGQQWTATMANDFFAPSFIGHSFAGYGTGSFSDSQLSFIFFEEPTGPKTYQIESGGASDNDHVSIYYSPTFFSDGMLGPTYNGQAGGEFVLTKYDIGNGIAEGTFEFSAKNEDTNETLQFTEGAFRIKIE
jgi:hypothetical protein